MKKLLLAVLFVVLPLHTWALPLPSAVDYTFTGLFSSEVYDFAFPLAGDMQFCLLSQEDVPWAAIDNVSWSFSGSSSDGLFSFTGYLYNEFHNQLPSTTTTWRWHDWTTDLRILEGLSGNIHSWDDIDWIGSGRGAGPDWDVLDNSFFLPAELTYSLFDGYNHYGVDRLYLSLSPVQSEPAPVPEPATIFLLGSGLAGLAAWRRRRG